MDLIGLRESVRAFLASWRDAGRFTPRCDGWIRGFDPEFSAEVGRRGWIGMTWPRRFGGSEASYLERLVVTEELLAAGAPVAAHWFADRQIGPTLLRFGSEELQEEFLPRIARAEATFAICMSESEAGSDLAAVRTTATRDGDVWRLRGTKIWTTHAHRASHAYVLARTGRGDNRHEGLSEFVVDLSSDGVDVRAIADLQGEHHFNEVHFDDVAVPHRWVIGELGNGWHQVTTQLSFERGGPERILSTYPLLDALIGRAREAGTPDAASLVGALAARLVSLRHQAMDIARAMDQGEAPVTAAAALKIAGTAYEKEVVEAARRLAPDDLPDLDGTGLASMVGDALLSSPTFTLRGGTSEVLLGIVARATVAT